jgi:cyclopropane-fatty-acyl-phospholipid synthase
MGDRPNRAGDRFAIEDIISGGVADGSGGTVRDDRSVTWEQSREPRPRSGALDANVVGLLLKAFEGVPIGFVLWDGTRLPADATKPVAWIHVSDRRTLLKLALNPDLQFGELYSAGKLDVDGSLVALGEAVYRVSFTSTAKSPLAAALRFVNRPRGNAEQQSRENIHHHYDIGNDFYRLWLDQQLVYTCAYFPDPAMTLEDAQVAKMDYVCRKLDLRPGDRVVEAGCGWGALALHMARHYGATVRAFNISTSQLAHARERARAEGLSDCVEFVEGDYREMRGEYDAFVSIGMLEHVGPRHYRELGRVIDGVLTPAGRGLIHSIGSSLSAPMNPWIERHIFPGAYTPTVREMMDVLEPFRFAVLDVENLRQHYARTLEHWLARYEAHADEVLATFDEPFARTWRLYLSGSIAAFRTGALQLYQVLFNRTGAADGAWTRAVLYRD